MNLFKTVTGLLLLLLAVGGGLAILVIDKEPLVTESSALSPTELRRAREFIRDVFDANQSAAQPTNLDLSESDTEILLVQVLDKLRGGDADVEYRPGRLRLRLTASIPESILGRYANIDFTLLQEQDQLLLDNFTLGSLELPGWLADPLLQFGHEKLQLQLPEYAMLVNSISSYAFSEGKLALRYTLTPETLGQLSVKGSELLFDPETSERLQSHAAYLAALEATLEPEVDPRNANISLARILGPMFRFARSRGGDPAEENRATLLVLALHQMDMNPARLLQGDRELPELKRRLHFTLHQRRDYAQHFLGSAVLAVNMEPALAEAIVLLKEMDDAQEGGSGFSFTDLAADMAGIRFAEAAVTNEQTAARVQALMGANTDEDFFLFDVRGLPEFLTEAEFKTSYGDTDSETYRNLVDHIGSEIAATRLYQVLDQTADN
jgi:hypothetical protein